MSTLFSHADNIMYDGISSKILYIRRHPTAPIASKNAVYGLYAQTWSLVACMTLLQNSKTCLLLSVYVSLRAVGIFPGTGSRPTQSRELDEITACCSFSVNVIRKVPYS